MANEMIKFLRGNVANLPQTATAGTLYFTKDEGIYMGMEDGSYHRYGDFITVADVNSLPTAGAHATCMYYCTAENILARYDSEKAKWIQINKQPTAEEMKTLLGLGALAYKTEVAEGDLNTELAKKINDASAANHGHDNKAVIDGITAEKVAAWDAAEGNAKGHADGLNTAMNTRVEALETAIGENGSVANQIKTAIEALDFTDTAVDGEYVSAVNEVDGKISVTRKALPDYTNTYDTKGAAATALDNAKAYADGLAANYDEKGAAAGVKTELEAEIAKKVDKVEGKSLISDSEIARLATLANYDDTQVKADIAKKADADTMTTELDKKVDKVEGYSLVADTEIARLANVGNYDDTTLAGRVTDAEGKITALESASATHATKGELNTVDAKFANYKTADDQKAIDDEQDRRLGVIEGDYLKAADIANFETKENVKKVADDLAAYVESNDGALAGVKATAEAARTEDEVNAQIDAKIGALNLATTYEPIGAETRAKAYADGLITDANLAQYTTEQEVKDIVDGVIAGAVDGDTITGLANLVEYLNTHGGEAAEMGAAIDVLEGKVETIEGKPAYGITATQISNWDNEVGAKALAETKTTTAEVKDQIEAYGYATTGYTDGKANDAKDAAIADAASKYETKGTAQGIVDGLKLSETYEPIGAEGRAIAAAKTETENQVKALADGQVTTNKNDIATLFEMFQWGEF